MSSFHNFSDVLNSEFSAPISNPELNLIKHLKQLHSGPQFQLVSTTVNNDTAFPLSEFLASRQNHPEVVNEQTHVSFNFDNSKSQQKVYPDVVAGIVKFSYNSVNFYAYKATWSTTKNSFYFYGLVFEGSDDRVGRELASEVYRWGNNLKEEIWVFEGGWWSKNKMLYQAVKTASWDDVVLKDEFKEGLKRDAETFFASKEVYNSLGITWKRGILLLGPPGNGKTESIKALLNELEYPALYVKSFTTNFGPEHGVRTIFDRARKHSPCILVLEDLDAMVTEKVRSFFLNELDGLAQNDGILTIATTNHPERIDDAILNRPSRFDVKYDFSLPDLELRKAFATKWIRKVQALGGRAANGEGVILRRSLDEVAQDVAEKTDGWSFAFLKELFISFLLRLAHDSSLRKTNKTTATPDISAESVLLKQIEQLASQIIRLQGTKTTKEEEDEDGRWCPPPIESVSRSADLVNF
ncbi:P-loop containing nucleoside triphosphate hydrolase protein [Abortiporus biennis]|nr:P-loop containing nucleoside triphosphate hydrolase protein [Abortiporus biennis]